MSSQTLEDIIVALLAIQKVILNLRLHYTQETIISSVTRFGLPSPIPSFESSRNRGIKDPNLIRQDSVKFVEGSIYDYRIWILSFRIWILV